jgi:spore coat protein U-like protein
MAAQVVQDEDRSGVAMKSTIKSSRGALLRFVERRCMIAVLVLTAFGAKPAFAASCTAYASGIVFGNYTGGLLDVTGTITVTCTSGTAYNIGLNAGNTTGATITNRLMFGGSGGQNTLGYQLFSDAAYTINWGNSSGTNWVSGTGNGSAQPYNIYARIPANVVAATGSYTDTITASITGAFTTATAAFSVTATVQMVCTISATNLSFGGYTGTNIYATSVITVQCNNTSAAVRPNIHPPPGSFSIGLDAGTAPGATVTTRSMTGPGGALVGYLLFQDAGHTKNWGNSPGVDTVDSAGTGLVQNFTVFGQLPAGQESPAGTYTDTITATVTF